MGIFKDIVELVERGLHEKATSFTGNDNDTDTFKITRRRGKKKQVNYVVTESDLKFGVYSRPHFDKGSVKIKIMSNHPHDDYYDNYNGIVVTFHKDGKIDYSADDESARAELSKYKDQITKTAREYLGDYI